MAGALGPALARAVAERLPAGLRSLHLNFKRCGIDYARHDFAQLIGRIPARLRKGVLLLDVARVDEL